MNDKVEIKEFLLELLQDKADFALLFGSLAKGDGQGRAESDVDCGVFFHSDIAADNSYWDIAERFEVKFGRKLDLVCLNKTDIIISAQILAHSELLFAKSESQVDAWRAQVMSRYFDFKQSRRIIEENILVRPNHG